MHSHKKITTINKTSNMTNALSNIKSVVLSFCSFSQRLSVVLFVEHVVEPQSPFFDVGLVLLVLQVVGDDDA